LPTYFSYREFIQDKNGNLAIIGYMNITGVANVTTVTSNNGTTWTLQHQAPSGLANTMTWDMSKTLKTGTGALYISAYANDYSLNLYKWYLFKSSNGGVSWNEVDTYDNANYYLSQLSLAEGKDGSIVAPFIRYDGTGQILTIRKSLDGITWQTAHTINNIDSFSIKDAIVDTTGNIVFYGQKSVSSIYSVVTLTNSCN
jgi:hypothetical protein